MRSVKQILGVLGVTVLLIGGSMAVLIGYSNQIDYNNAYVVGFGDPSEECGEEELSINVNDGSVLYCAPSGMSAGSGAEASLPGFTGAQNDEVLELATKLGKYGLTYGEQEQIQDRVDEIADTVPVEDRQGGRGWLGYPLALQGAGVLILGIFGLRALMRAPGP